jgi:hypothetical protein
MREARERRAVTEVMEVRKGREEREGKGPYERWVK